MGLSQSSVTVHDGFRNVRAENVIMYGCVL